MLMRLHPLGVIVAQPRDQSAYSLVTRYECHLAGAADTFSLGRRALLQGGPFFVSCSLSPFGVLSCPKLNWTVK